MSCSKPAPIRVCTGGGGCLDLDDSTIRQPRVKKTTESHYTYYCYSTYRYGPFWGDLCLQLSFIALFFNSIILQPPINGIFDWIDLMTDFFFLLLINFLCGMRHQSVRARNGIGKIGQSSCQLETISTAAMISMDAAILALTQLEFLG